LINKLTAEPSQGRDTALFYIIFHKLLKARLITPPANGDYTHHSLKRKYPPPEMLSEKENTVSTVKTLRGRGYLIPINILIYTEIIQYFQEKPPALPFD